MWYVKVVRNGLVMKYEHVEFPAEIQALRWIMTLISTREEMRKNCTFFIGQDGKPARQVFQN